MFQRATLTNGACACRACLATGIWRAWLEVASAIDDARRACPMDWCGGW